MSVSNTRRLKYYQQYGITMSQVIVTVTKKGQATIPKKMREKHRIGRRALVEDTSEGVLVKPIPTPSMERGSLRTLFNGRSSKEIMGEVRKQESTSEEKLHRGRSS